MRGNRAFGILTPVRGAFTLVELLVVLGLIAFGTAVLVHGLAHTRPNVRVTQCLANKRQVALACIMYSHDWNDYLVPNAPASDPRAWCNSQENWTSALANTNAASYNTNCLAQYVAGDLKVYKCPDDTIPSDNGPRIRSISMNSQMLGALPNVNLNYNIGWRTFKKVGDLTSPTPAMAWIFADESMYSLNDGFLQMGLNSLDYPDLPAAYHGGANCFTFADGHAEAHKWEWKGPYYSGLLSCPYVKNVTGTHWPSSGLDLDYYWLMPRTSARTVP